jgi:mono/diheme cytochrome c family protein
MKKVLLTLGIIAVLFGCSSESQNKPAEDTDYNHPDAVATAPANDGRGVGPAKNITLDAELNQEMINRGQAIYEMKCQACHRLDDQRVVGPGWKGLSERRKPEWIINMIVNVDEMLEKDEVAQQLVEEYLMKMPDQNVSMDEARDILEYIRHNDKK